jgi:hypothetical protein
MADIKPPRSSADDRDVLLTLLRYQRESMVRKGSGIDDAAGPMSTTSSLHLARGWTGAREAW